MLRLITLYLIGAIALSFSPSRVDALDLIAFKVTGPGVIAAVDSGNNTSHEPFQASERKAHQGRCFAMIKASGAQGRITRITLAASAPGLKGSSVSIAVRK